jgi:hypothetical protein
VVWNTPSSDSSSLGYDHDVDPERDVERPVLLLRGGDDGPLRDLIRRVIVVLCVEPGADVLLVALDELPQGGDQSRAAERVEVGTEVRCGVSQVVAHAAGSAGGAVSSVGVVRASGGAATRLR